MVNTSHDVTTYECLSNYKRDVIDANNLYDAFRKAEKGSDWKPQVQKFGMTYLLGLSKMQAELAEDKYCFKPTSTFVVHERGKKRVIQGEQIEDRTLKHDICDNVLNPCTSKYLIFDNGASQQNKGIDFTRRRLEYHLHKYYRQYGNNGYILLIDFSKYYDNIRHDVLKEQFRKYINDEYINQILSQILERSEVDVSYMSDEEYNYCMEKLFNALDYQNIDKSLKTGKKMMKKHLNIGDQVSQTSGIIYPIPIDNYIKIVKGVKFYARYSDDSYVIDRSKEFLKQLLQEITEITKEIGITINRNKTRICKLSDYWRFLQIRYSLTDTGRIIKKINPKRLTAMRRKMKSISCKLTNKEFTDFFYSWFKANKKYMSNKQKENMLNLFKEELLCTR